MDDSGIVELYWTRSESAIAETSSKYGKYCYSIAYNILLSSEDADESVNDTYLGAWNSMPPHRPSTLSTFLGKITRRISIDRWRKRNAAKRGGGEVALALDELSECLLSRSNDTEQTILLKELQKSMNDFLSTLALEERDIFVCRYWFLASIAEISEKFGISQSKTKSKLFRTRKKLQAHMQREGF